MGLLDRFTETKTCAICGKELRLLGKTRLEDGYLCKDDARRLSPFFTNARSSTVEQIKEQLAYRDANEAKVASFVPTRELGGSWRVLVDDNARAVIVTNERDWRDGNPDVIPFDDVIGCDERVDEDRTELYREDEEGNRQSYDPPRYETEYDFWVTVRVNSPYFPAIKFKVNSWSIEDRWGEEYRSAERQAAEICGTLRTLNGAAPDAATSAAASQQGYAAPGYPAAHPGPEPGAPGHAPGYPAPQGRPHQPAYAPQHAASQQDAPQRWPAAAPSFCPSCGAPVKTGARFCESCGARLV